MHPTGCVEVRILPFPREFANSITGIRPGVIPWAGEVQRGTPEGMRSLKYYLIVGVTILGTLAMGCLVFKSACMDLPTAKVELGIQADDFGSPTKSAMGLMNGFVGCEFLVPGDDVRVLSTDGQPCGKSFHPAIEDGHSAGAYDCKDEKRATRYEVHVSYPGNTHTQTCIIAHEIGHVAGLEDHKVRRRRGIMNQYNCPTPIVLADAEVDFLRAKFCY